MYSASGRSPVAQTRSPSSKLKGISDVGGSQLGVSSAAVGKGPAQKALMLAASFTFPVLQYISGLWSFNQVCPRMGFCFPRLVTQNKALSECLSTTIGVLPLLKLNRLY